MISYRISDLIQKQKEKKILQLYQERYNEMLNLSKGKDRVCFYFDNIDIGGHIYSGEINFTFDAYRERDDNGNNYYIIDLIHYFILPGELKKDDKIIYDTNFQDNLTSKIINKIGDETFIKKAQKYLDEQLHRGD